MSNTHDLACCQSCSRWERYTNAKIADMHLAYGITDFNGRVAQRWYTQPKPSMQNPSYAFARLHYRLSENDLSLWIHRNVSEE
ncbi:hypothetical protein TNCV_966201 [Trichonephila clavipes]|nr:hypothetical protein TNCV_966201 [Trichonephila clavipes]